MFWLCAIPALFFLLKLFFNKILCVFTENILFKSYSFVIYQTSPSVFYYIGLLIVFMLPFLMS